MEQNKNKLQKQTRKGREHFLIEHTLTQPLTEHPHKPTENNR